MSLEILDDKLKEQLLCLGIPQNETTLQMALCVAITKQALQGNIKAFEIIQNTLGQNPSAVIENEEKATIIFINDIEDLSSKNNDTKGVI